MLNFDDDTIEQAVCPVKLQDASMTETARTCAQEKHGIMVFQLPADSPLVTTEKVRRMESERAGPLAQITNP